MVALEWGRKKVPGFMTRLLVERWGNPSFNDTLCLVASHSVSLPFPLLPPSGRSGIRVISSPIPLSLIPFSRMFIVVGLSPLLPFCMNVKVERVHGTERKDKRQTLDRAPSILRAIACITFESPQVASLITNVDRTNETRSTC